MPELLVLAPFVPVELGEVFERGTIPLHVTVLPNVILPHAATGGFCDAVTQAASVVAPLSITGDRVERFGPHNDVTVTVIRPLDDVGRLHRELLCVALRLGATSVDPEYNGAGYHAHVSRTRAGALAVGETIVLDRLAVLERMPRSHRVVRVAELVATG